MPLGPRLRPSPRSVWTRTAVRRSVGFVLNFKHLHASHARRVSCTLAGAPPATDSRQRLSRLPPLRAPMAVKEEVAPPRLGVRERCRSRGAAGIQMRRVAGGRPAPAPPGPPFTLPHRLPRRQLVVGQKPGARHDGGIRPTRPTGTSVRASNFKFALQRRDQEGGGKDRQQSKNKDRAVV